MNDTTGRQSLFEAANLAKSTLRQGILRSPSRPLRTEKPKLATKDMPAEASLARAVENSIEHQSDIIERRLMNQSIEPHECMKLIKQCVDDQLSRIDCMASCVVGELWI